VSRLLRAALAVCGLLALGACKVDVSVHVDVAEDGSGTITLSAIADAEVVARAPGLAEDLQFDDAVAAGWTVEGPTATANGGLQVEITHEFATVAEATALLQSINGTGGPLHDLAITRVVTDAQVTTFLAGSLRVEGGLEAFADSDLLTAIGGGPYVEQVRDEGLTPSDAVTFTFTADLPGELLTAEGATPAPMSWTVPMDGTAANVAATTAIARGGNGIWGTVSTIALVALGAWILVAIAFIAFVAKARRRKARTAAAAAGGFRVRPLTRR